MNFLSGRLVVLIFLSCVLASACGGGSAGSESGGPDSPPANPIVDPSADFNLNELVSEFYSSDGALVFLDAKIEKKLPENARWKLEDKDNLIFYIIDGDYNISGKIGIQFKRDIAANNYSGQFKISFCMDEVEKCAKPLPDVSGLLPYKIKVKPLPNLIAVKELSNGRDWVSRNGVSTNNAYIPSRIDQNKINHRFRFIPPMTYYQQGGAVTKNKKVLFTTRANGASEHIYAVDETTGALSWSKPLSFGNIPLTIGNNSVFFSSYVNVPGSLDRSPGVISLNIADGAFISSGVINMEEAIFSDGDLYYSDFVANLRSGRGPTKVDAVNYSVGWSQKIPQVSAALPAVNDLYAYFYEEFDSSLFKIEKKSGQILAVIKSPQVAFNRLSTNYVSPPVLCDASTALVLHKISPTEVSIRNFNIAANNFRYEVRGNFFTNLPVCANGMFYVLSVKGLEAYRMDDGSHVWTWDAPKNDLPIISTEQFVGTVASNLILFDNLIFFGLSNALYAIDVNSRSMVWHESPPRYSGCCIPRRLSVSKYGILYVSGSGPLLAFNLH